MSLPVIPEIVNTVRKFYEFLKQVKEELKEITDRIKKEARAAVQASLAGVNIPFIRCVNEWAPQAATVIKNTQHKIGKAVQWWNRNTQRTHT
jgi:hypothetical protein|nr:MAG TPA: hypothetical protein [Caudoviricetes sp.]